MTTRRTFLKALPLGVGMMVLAKTAHAADVSESNPMAQQLGYKSDTGRVDQKRYPQHTTAQKCASCSQYRPNGSCTVFAGKNVSANGWCASWSAKP